MEDNHTEIERWKTLVTSIPRPAYSRLPRDKPFALFLAVCLLIYFCLAIYAVSAWASADSANSNISASFDEYADNTSSLGTSVKLKLVLSKMLRCYLGNVFKSVPLGVLLCVLFLGLSYSFPNTISVLLCLFNILFFIIGSVICYFYLKGSSLYLWLIIGGALQLILVMCYVKRILTVAVLLQCAFLFLKQKLVTLIIPGLYAVIISLTVTVWIAAYYYALSAFVSSNLPEIMLTIIEVFWVFMIFLIGLTLYESIIFHVALEVALWFYHEQEDSHQQEGTVSQTGHVDTEVSNSSTQKNLPVATTLKWLICCQLGTIVKATFLKPLVRISWILISILQFLIPLFDKDDIPVERGFHIRICHKVNAFFQFACSNLICLTSSLNNYTLILSALYNTSYGQSSEILAQCVASQAIAYKSFNFSDYYMSFYFSVCPLIVSLIFLWAVTGTRSDITSSSVDAQAFAASLALSGFLILALSLCFVIFFITIINSVFVYYSLEFTSLRLLKKMVNVGILFEKKMELEGIYTQAFGANYSKIKYNDQELFSMTEKCKITTIKGTQLLNDLPHNEDFLDSETKKPIILVKSHHTTARSEIKSEGVSREIPLKEAKQMSRDRSKHSSGNKPLDFWPKTPKIKTTKDHSGVL